MPKKPDYDLLIQCLAEGEMKQKDIASLVGITPCQVSRIARGQSMPWLQGSIRAARVRLGAFPRPLRGHKEPLTELEMARRWISYAYARYLWDRELADENNLYLRFAQMIAKSAKPVVDTDALLELYRQVARTRKVAEKTPLDAKIA